MNRAKDAAWNRRLVASQPAQGIMLGESIPKMAKRVARVAASNESSAVRTARTYATAAQNAGRVSSYRRAQGMGIELEQEQLATMDNRTRHSHRQLDGERAPVGGTFPNGCKFPGDPDGPASEIYNCRCALVAAVEGISTDDARRWSRLPAGTTYEEWKAGYAKGERREAIEKRESAAKQGHGESGISDSAEGTGLLKDRIAQAVRSYIDESRKMGLTAPGFRPRPRKPVELPKREYASVMSAINSAYPARFEGKTKARIAVRNHLYTFEIHGFNKYKITKREPLE